MEIFMKSAIALPQQDLILLQNNTVFDIIIQIGNKGEFIYYKKVKMTKIDIPIIWGY
jgi:hypothetical protein